MNPDGPPLTSQHKPSDRNMSPPVDIPGIPAPVAPGQPNYDPALSVFQTICRSSTENWRRLGFKPFEGTTTRTQRYVVNTSQVCCGMSRIMNTRTDTDRSLLGPAAKTHNCIRRGRALSDEAIEFEDYGGGDGSSLDWRADPPVSVQYDNLAQDEEPVTKRVRSGTRPHSDDESVGAIAEDDKPEDEEEDEEDDYEFTAEYFGRLPEIVTDSAVIAVLCCGNAHGLSPAVITKIEEYREVCIARQWAPEEQMLADVLKEARC